MDLAVLCYEVTKEFPHEERFGMIAQIRRAAASVPANIAEGYGREYRKEYVQFLRVSQGSLKELETHLILSNRIGYISSDKLEHLLSNSGSLGKSLRTLIRALT